MGLVCVLVCCLDCVAGCLVPMFVVSVFWCAFTASGALLVAWGVCCIVVICVLLCMVG